MCNPRKLLGEVMLELGLSDSRIVAVSCDSTNGGLAPFAEMIPDRFVECGIAEQNAVSVCAGLAKTGFIPFLAAINPFLTMRSYEQIRDDVGYACQNVKLIGTGAGLAYSTLGASHETMEDLAVMRSIPNITILSPYDGRSLRSCISFAASTEGPFYIRMPLQPIAESLACIGEQKPINKLESMRDGSDVLIIATGTMVAESMAASGLLSGSGREAAVISATCLKPLDRDELLNAVSGYPLIVTVEEHCDHGGLGTAVAEILASSGTCPKLMPIGIPEKGALVTGEYRDVLGFYGLTGEQLSERILGAL